MSWLLQLPLALGSEDNQDLPLIKKQICTLSHPRIPDGTFNNSFVKTQLNSSITLTPQRPFALELGDNQDLALMKSLSQLSLLLLLRPANYYKTRRVCANTFYQSFMCKSLQIYIWMQHWHQTLDVDCRMWSTWFQTKNPRQNHMWKLQALRLDVYIHAKHCNLDVIQLVSKCQS